MQKRRLCQALSVLSLLTLSGVSSGQSPFHRTKVWEEGKWNVYQDLSPIFIEKKTWTYQNKPARYDMRATNNSSRALCLIITLEPIENTRTDQMAKQSFLLPNHRTDLGWFGAKIPSRSWDARIHFSSTHDLSRCFDD